MRSKTKVRIAALRNPLTMHKYKYLGSYAYNLTIKKMLSDPQIGKISRRITSITTEPAYI